MNDVTEPGIETALRTFLRADAPAAAPEGLLARVLEIPDAKRNVRRDGRPPAFLQIVGLAGSAAVLAVAIIVLALTRVGPFAVSNVGSRPANPVAWSTPYAALIAQDFAIEAGDQRFTASVAQVDVHSDPGDATYETLELAWPEAGVGMRLYLYFAADSTDWWVSEIRTYDGLPNTTGSNWIYYRGPFFRTPLGESYRGDVDLTSNGSDNGVTGHLRISGVQLRAFSADAPEPGTGGPGPGQITPTACPSGSPSDAKCATVGLPPSPSASASDDGPILETLAPAH